MTKFNAQGRPKEADEPVNSRTVLVVDDEVVVRMSIADELHGAGYHVIEAANAEEALTLLNSGTIPDLLMTDVQMPGAHDGLELARIVHAAYPDMKIVVVSASLPGGSDEAVDVTLAKPYDPNELLGVVATLLSPGSTSDTVNSVGDT